MVRNLVGTIAQVGLGRFTPKEFENILKAKDRRQAGTTAPAKGLFLIRVNYHQNTFGDSLSEAAS